MITIHDPILHGEKGSDRNKKLSEFSFTVDIDDVRDALSLAMAIRGLVALYFKNQLPVHAILKFIDEIPRGFKFKVQHPVLGYWRLLKKLHRVS